MGIPQLTDHQRDLAIFGKCPFCERNIKGWKPLFGFFASEWWATMNEDGIDGGSGHLKTCPHKDLRL